MFFVGPLGTGVVHMAPAHGQEDYDACRAHGKAIEFNLVDAQGRFNADAGASYAGACACGRVGLSWG